MQLPGLRPGLLRWGAAALLIFGRCAAAKAGGGPENLLLVVNRRSVASLTIANYFQRWRSISSANVLGIDFDPNAEGTDIESFREKLLRPILSTLETRGLDDQIDYIVYSSDFPTRIDFQKDLPPGQQQKPYLAGSLTGLTYLAQHVLVKSPQYVSLSSNRYLHHAAAGEKTPSHGFRNWYGWGPKGQLLEAGGSRYALSVMLAVNAGRGNSVAESLTALERAVKADGTLPHGSIYYAKTGDIRSTTRQPGFDAAVEELKSLGIEAQVIDSALPEKRDDVQGLMMGLAGFNWKASGSTISPGAICENLTSYGAIFEKGASQTPLTEYIRYGAAGSSGTVIEPFAIPNKFPAADIQVHYAHGCSLAESFYQSVAGPFQLLIVGDPLCQPWAKPPHDIQLEGLPEDAVLRGKLSLKPTGKAAGDAKIEHFELFLAGARIARCNPGESFQLDTTVLSDGYCELRVVAVDDTPIETQGRLIVSARIDNHGRTMQFSTLPEGHVRTNRTLKLTANAPGAIGIAFYHNDRILGKVAGDVGSVDLDPTSLGMGPVTLTAIGWGRGGAENHVVAKPVVVEVEPAR